MTRYPAIVLFMALSGCASVQPQRGYPPPEAAALCRALIEPSGDSVDAMVIAYVDTIDAYLDCALRHKALSEWSR